MVSGTSKTNETLLAKRHIQTMLVVRARVIMAFGQRRTFLVADSWGDALVITHNQPRSGDSIKPGTSVPGGSCDMRD